MRKGLEKLGAWSIRTELQFVNVRRGKQRFYECRANHPIYGETAPARSIDQEIAYQETLIRLKAIESKVTSMAATEVSQPIPMPEDTEERIDPLAAEFGHNLKPLNFTRRVENAIANHRYDPWRRPSGRVARSKLR